MIMILIYVIGVAISMVILAYLDIKYDAKLNDEAATSIILLWPIMLFFAFPVWLLMKIFNKSWEFLTNMFKKILKKGE